MQRKWGSVRLVAAKMGHERLRLYNNHAARLPSRRAPVCSSPSFESFQPCMRAYP